MTDEPDKDAGLKLALEAAGSGKALAAALGISQAAVSQWTRIPVDRVVQVETITKVKREHLRPDIFKAA